MPEPETSQWREHVDAWLRSAPLAELLPPRRRDAAPPRSPVEPLDALALGRGIALVVARSERGLVIVPVADADTQPRRAVAGDGVFGALLDLMRAGARVGAFSAHPAGPGAATPPTLVASREVAIAVDQSNDSVTVDGRAVVKLFPLVSPPSEPRLDVAAHLAAVGFTATPAPMGAVVWTDRAGHEAVLASATTFLPGARDGWDWYLERLLAWLDGDIDDAAALEPAATIGRMVGEMHVGLATPSPQEPVPTSRADDATADEWRREALDLAGEALELTDGDEGARLAARMSAIRRELQALGRAAGTTLTPVHGDLHVGQVLEWDGGYAIADFDGNPTARTRRAVDTPVRDVAAFVRSLDHLGRVASRRRTGRESMVESWIASSRAGFLLAYRRALAAADRNDLDDDRLLRPLEVAQECHEFVYAARFLPRWRSVPDLAMQALVSQEDHRRGRQER